MQALGVHHALPQSLPVLASGLLVQVACQYYLVPGRTLLFFLQLTSLLSLATFLWPRIQRHRDLRVFQGLASGNVVIKQREQPGSRGSQEPAETCSPGTGHSPSPSLPVASPVHEEIVFPQAIFLRHSPLWEAPFDVHMKWIPLLTLGHAQHARFMVYQVLDVCSLQSCASVNYHCRSF